MTIHRSAWQARGRRAESELEVVVGALVWKVLGTGAAIGAGVVARKLITRRLDLGNGQGAAGQPRGPPGVVAGGGRLGGGLGRLHRRGPAAGDPQGGGVLHEVGRPPTQRTAEGHLRLTHHKPQT